MRVYPKITVSQKFLLFYPNPKGDKRNFKLVPVQKWDTPFFCLRMLKFFISGYKKYYFMRVYPKITVSQKFLLFYPNPKGDKRNFKLVPVQKWDTPFYDTHLI
jgi:phage pi2 protein 07